MLNRIALPLLLCCALCISPRIVTAQTTPQCKNVFNSKINITNDASKKLKLSPFKRSSSQQKIRVGEEGSKSIKAGRYRDITVGEKGRVTFTSKGGTVLANKLSLQEEARAVFVAGDYWIKDIKLGEEANISVSGSGTVRIYAKKITIGEGAQVNTKKAANNLVLVAYTQANNQADSQVVIGEEARVKAFIYSKNKIVLQEDSRVWGAINSKQIKREEDARVDSQLQVLTKTQFNTLCSFTAPPPPQPLAYYQFEDLNWSPGTAIDEGDDTVVNQAQAVGAASIVLPHPQVSCQALSIPANNSANTTAALDTAIDINRLGNNGSISFWYRSNQAWRSGHARQLFDASTSNNNRYFYLALSTNGSLELGMEDRNDKRFRGTSERLAFAANTWVHIAVSWDLPTRTMRMYANGQPLSLTMHNENLTNSLADFDTLYIGDSRSGYFGGNSSTGHSADGYFDNVRIYDHVQSASEVRKDHNTVTTCVRVDHYRLDHPGTGLTCEPLAMQIRACANASCTLATTPSSITLQPTGFSGASVSHNRVSFTGNENRATSIALAQTTAGMVTLTATTANPSAPLRCFVGNRETCQVNFVDSGLLLTADAKQTAESNFTGVSLRAIRRDDNSGACAAAIAGRRSVDFSYGCINPASCKTPLNIGSASINATGQASGSNTIDITFGADGIAKLPAINFADAGRLQLSASTRINNASLSSNSVSLDVVPDRLAISTPDLPHPAVAGDDFSLRLVALGKHGAELANYQPGRLAQDTRLVSPLGGHLGQLTLFTDAPGVGVDGVYTDNHANYSETGKVQLTIQDNHYLGQYSLLSNALILGDFIPSYYHISYTQPTLADTHTQFTYVGQRFVFASGGEVTLNITAKNGQNATSRNFDDGHWLWNKDDKLSSFTFIDNAASSASALTLVSDSEPKHSISGDTFDGSLQVSINNITLFHHKPASPIDPFTSSIAINIPSSYFTDTVMQKQLCFKQQASDNTCLGLTIDKITGTHMRYGRLRFEHAYGPETEALRIPVYSEYFIANGWMRNTLDSATNMLWQEGAQLTLQKSDTGSDLTDDISEVLSYGSLINGRALPGDGPILSAPAPERGEVSLSLGMDAARANLEYLNIDWNADGAICHGPSKCADGPDANAAEDEVDAPSANATFGLYRGNDRIIHWREQF